MAVARSSERYFVLARSAIFKMIAALRRKGGEGRGREEEREKGRKQGGEKGKGRSRKQ